MSANQIKEYFTKSPYATIEVHPNPVQCTAHVCFGNEENDIVTTGRFVVVNQVTGSQFAFPNWDSAKFKRAEISQRYAHTERAFR